MKATHTILMPGMLPIHFQIVRHIFMEYGYKVELLDNEGPSIAQLGLQYVHNDTCYPALLVIGQMIDALRSGKYDPDQTALFMSQTGGGCRASNYIHLLRKALRKAGFPQVPVISLNLRGLEENPGFQLTLPMLRKAVAALLYGDELMLLSNQVRPYEAEAGATDRLLAKWIARIGDNFRLGMSYGMLDMQRMLDRIAWEFAAIPTVSRDKLKVGIVGEIYMQYAPLGNNNLEAFLQSQGCEVMLPGVLGFAAYCTSNGIDDRRLYGNKLTSFLAAKALTAYVVRMEKMLLRAISKTHLKKPGTFAHKRKLVQSVVGLGSKMGEGWLLPAEILDLIETGYNNIICTQPFGCLPNHINGRGAINRIKELLPSANIVAIDYDPGASRVNQENRI
ncbi:MAG: 2-hydroxyglutaryl-CoA dehydratase, partial [Clostridiales bacterium]|nr:2-hydroxyglutaryl-CoA dehydratase [Clostridiales bacterium]